MGIVEVESEVVSLSSTYLTTLLCTHQCLNLKLKSLLVYLQAKMQLKQRKPCIGVCIIFCTFHGLWLVIVF